jgi:hypothetical protein
MQRVETGAVSKEYLEAVPRGIADPIRIVVNDGEVDAPGQHRNQLSQA